MYDDVAELRALLALLKGDPSSVRLTDSTDDDCESGAASLDATITAVVAPHYARLAERTAGP